MSVSAMAQQADPYDGDEQPVPLERAATSRAQPGAEPQVQAVGLRRPGGRNGGSDAWARRRLKQLTKLQSAMSKKLDLTRDQEEAIDGLFKEYVQTLKGVRSRPRPFGTTPEDAAELKELRKELREARKAGDETTVRALRKKFREKMRERQAARGLTVNQFLTQVGEQLTDEQRPEFRKLVKTLKIGYTGNYSSSGDLRILWRATMEPEVGLSVRQKRAINVIIRDGVASVLEAEREGESAAEIAAKVRADVLGELKPFQRAKVEMTLQERAAGARSRPSALPPDRGPRRRRPERIGDRDPESVQDPETGADTATAPDAPAESDPVEDVDDHTPDDERDSEEDEAGEDDPG